MPQLLKTEELSQLHKSKEATLWILVAYLAKANLIKSSWILWSKQPLFVDEVSHDLRLSPVHESGRLTYLSKPNLFTICLFESLGSL